jgi:sarcosine oxidase
VELDPAIACRPAPPGDAEFVVVGAGVLGLSTAAALRRRGREVLVLERAAVGHERSGSKGSARIFRLGYDDPRYVEMAKVALRLWRDLEAEAGAELLTTTGQLTFGPGIDLLATALSDAGAPAEVVPAHEAERRFPAVAAPGPAVFEPESGMIHAARCLDTLRLGLADCVYEGLKVIRVDQDERGTRVVTGAGAVHAAATVCCAGPWTAPLLEPLLASTGTGWPLSVALEQVAYLSVRSSPDRKPQDPLTPVIVERTEPSLYGLPTPEGQLYKVGRHHAGRPSDPDAADLSPDPDVERELGQAAARLLPGLDPRPVRSERCFYDNSPDTDFVLERVGRIIIGAGTSGHGFKFGPLLGELLADLAVGAPARVPIDWLGAARFRP